MSRLLVVAIVATLIGLMFMDAPEGGFGNSCIIVGCQMAVSSSLLGVVGGLAVFGFAFVYRQAPNRPVLDKPVGVLQRLAAFFIDYLIVLSGLVPVLMLPALIVEARYTGGFEWAFERDFSRQTDTITIVPAILATFLGLFLYFYIHTRRRRQTVGQYLLAYRLQGKDAPGAKPAYAANVMFSLVGLCAWPVSLFYALKRPDKAFWWNLATDTQAVRVTHARPPAQEAH